MFTAEFSFLKSTELSELWYQSKICNNIEIKLFHKVIFFHWIFRKPFAFCTSLPPWMVHPWEPGTSLEIWSIRTCSILNTIFISFVRLKKNTKIVAENSVYDLWFRYQTLLHKEWSPLKYNKKQEEKLYRTKMVKISMIN